MKVYIRSIFVLLVFFNIYAVEKNGKKLNFDWVNEDEVVFVIQDKEFPKSGRFNFEFILIDSENQPYYDVSGMGGGLTYYLNENWGIDFFYKKYSASKSNDLNSLINDRNVKPLVRNVTDTMFLSVNWLPFYGKINVFDKIFYFDWGLGAGYGSATVQSNEDTFTKSNIPLTLKQSKASAFNLKSYLKFYAFENVNFGLQYDLTFFESVIGSGGQKGQVSINDILFTVGYMFP